MTMRFCEKCSAEVEDVGGFCLLGHPLKLDPLIPSVAHVRHEVDRVLEEVRDERYRQDEGNGSGGETHAQPPPPPDGRLARGFSLWESFGKDFGERSDDPIEAFAPPPRMDWGPSDRSSLLQRALRRAQGTVRV